MLLFASTTTSNVKAHARYLSDDVDDATGTHGWTTPGDQTAKAAREKIILWSLARDTPPTPPPPMAVFSTPTDKSVPVFFFLKGPGGSFGSQTSRRALKSQIRESEIVVLNRRRLINSRCGGDTRVVGFKDAAHNNRIEPHFYLLPDTRRSSFAKRVSTPRVIATNLIKPDSNHALSALFILIVIIIIILFFCIVIGNFDPDCIFIFRELFIYREKCLDFPMPGQHSLWKRGRALYRESESCV